MVSHNPQLFLKNNIRALELAFDIRKTKEQKISAEEKKTLEEYSGFGGISAILLPQIDHEVGGGKTLIMVITPHEMKRLGICNKPIIIGMKGSLTIAFIHPIT